MIKIHYMVWGARDYKYLYASAMPSVGDIVFLDEDTDYTVMAIGWQEREGVFEPVIELKG